MGKTVWVLELGIEPYDCAWELQHRLVAARRAEKVGDLLLLLEHEPVLTLGRRADESHILASPEMLQRLGVAVRRVERGGDVTYHGPGQIVGYPILRLADYGLGASDYMHALEEVLIRALADLGVAATRKPDLIGVWADGGKVAALGARIEEGVTYHGFALNVNPRMEHFALIVPCGLRDDLVTSMSAVLGQPLEMAQVRARVRHHFAQVFGVTLQEVSREELEAELKT